jgi:DNA invertase Pin-like site-specific DNA recombinase
MGRPQITEKQTDFSDRSRAFVLALCTTSNRHNDSRLYLRQQISKRSDGSQSKPSPTVVFAKLDRLTRDVDLLRSLVASDVDLVFCDLPHVPPGAMGRFLLTQMASVAELEEGLISERTKAALAAAKARGVKLGNPNGARALRGKQVGNKQAVVAVKAKAEQRAATLLVIADLAEPR